jgi:hypothetical protein
VFDYYQEDADAPPRVGWLPHVVLIFTLCLLLSLAMNMDDWPQYGPEKTLIIHIAGRGKVVSRDKLGHELECATATCTFTIRARGVTLSAESPDAAFQKWTGACNGQQPQCEMPSLSERQSTTAVFK